MRKIIDKKVYDIETGKFIVGYHNGLSRGDLRFLSEDLYVTKKGQYFLHAAGGAHTIYSRVQVVIRGELKQLFYFQKKNYMIGYN